MATLRQRTTIYATFLSAFTIAMRHKWLQARATIIRLITSTNGRAGHAVAIDTGRSPG